MGGVFSVYFYLMFEAFAGGEATVNAAIADVEADLLLPLCSDGIDNDRDGLIDALEPVSERLCEAIERVLQSHRRR